MSYEELRSLLERSEGPVPYLLLALVAALEYVFPPIPGDALAVAGIALSVAAGFGPIWVHLALTFGSTLGGLVAYGAGRALGDREDKWPSWLRRPSITRGVERVKKSFAKHGALILVVNRFVPALRGFFFLGAGIARVPVGPVALYGTISAAIWNALLVGLCFAVGHDETKMSVLLGKYTLVVLVLLAVAAVIMLVKRVARGPQVP